VGGKKISFVFLGVPGGGGGMPCYVTGYLLLFQNTIIDKFFVSYGKPL